MNATEKTYEVQLVGSTARRAATADEIAFAERIQWSAWLCDFNNTTKTGWDKVTVGFGRGLKTIYRSAS